MRTKVPSLASLRGLGIRHCCELWYRPATAAPIWPLAWEPPYATPAALKKRQQKKKKKKKQPTQNKQALMAVFVAEITAAARVQSLAQEFSYVVRVNKGGRKKTVVHLLISHSFLIRLKTDSGYHLLRNFCQTCYCWEENRPNTLNKSQHYLLRSNS